MDFLDIHAGRAIFSEPGLQTGTCTKLPCAFRGFDAAKKQTLFNNLANTAAAS